MATKLHDPRPLGLPPLEQIPVPQIEAAASEYLGLEADLKAAVAALAELEEARADAVAADRQAGADWIRAGRKGKEPAAQKTARADLEIAAAREARSRLQVAVVDSREALVRTVDVHHSAWQQAADDRATRAREAIAKHLDDLAAAHSDLQQALAVGGWLTAFPTRPRWLPTRYAAQITGLHRPSGDPTPVDAVLAGLRELVTPAVRVRPVPVRPLAPQPGVPVMDSAA